MTKTSPHTLYICYFGMRQPLVETQVLPYLAELSNGGIKVSLVTFEPNLKRDWTIDQIRETRERLSEMGIEWDCLGYHKSPSAIATAYDIVVGVRYVHRRIRADNVDVLHGRVHVPTLMGAIARRLSKQKPKLLFDIRGFFPEEYTDAGVWPENGILFRAAKRVEKWLMRESDAFVVLTQKARDILFPGSEDHGLDRSGRPVEVIPCCVDLENRFFFDKEPSREELRRELNVENRFVITHLGALGGLYLTNEIADLLETARAKDPSTFALFLTQTDPDLIVPQLLKRGFTAEDFFVGKVPPPDIPRYLRASDVGLSIVKAGYATASRSPTKIPEYLACGLPIISNRGVGDVDKLIIENEIGVLLDDFSIESYRKALEGIIDLGDVTEKCITTARREFDLKTVGGYRYRQLYARLLEGADHRARAQKN